MRRPSLADEEREIKTQIIQNCSSNKLHHLISTPDMTLQTLLETGRAMELADWQAMGVKGDREKQSTVSEVSQKKNGNPQ